MAKKKSKKKESKKEIQKKKLKKKALKKKALKKKEAKKKAAKKKEAKKKDSKKKALMKIPVQKQAKQIPAAKPSAKPITPRAKNVDLSSNHKVPDAIKRLKLLKSVDELLAFTKGEKRITVKKVIPVAKKRLEK